ncbi:MAG: hypothetical protein WBG90_09965 [Saonia sp.]
MEENDDISIENINGLSKEKGKGIKIREKHIVFLWLSKAFIVLLQ